MGGSGSTRRVVVESEASGVISISDDVVRRLRGEPERERNTSDPAPPPPRPEIPRYSTEELPYREERRILRATDVKYDERLKRLEQKIQELQDSAIDQFASAVEETEKKFINQTPTPVCQDLQEFVLSCYRTNPRTTLNCSQQVSAFSACVERARLNALSRRSQAA